MKLVGNARVVRAIEAAGGENPFHAYIISGPDGSGKTLTSRLLSSALVCTEGAGARPCGRCLACRKVSHGTHPDIRVIEMEGKESFLVGQSRELRADASRLPNEGRHKVYILPDAEHMNEAASNALLKILEEPPEYTVIVLIAENPAKLPETVRSRCVELRLRPVSAEEGLRALKEQFPEAEESVLASALEKGGMLVGAAADIIQGRDNLAQTAASVAEAVFSRDEFGLLAALMSLERAGKEEIRRELCELAKILSEAAMGKGKTSLSPRELCEAANKAAEIYGKSALYISAGNLLAGAAAELAGIISKDKK
ncbi:MAG: DNA polymerase III subunit delta' [Oscillospiraceae bacterium]|nr:DNA polymerase III subunit delta' [Oscillospiraceae bacterium]